MHTINLGLCYTTNGGAFDARSCSAPLLLSNRLHLLVAPRLLNQPLNSLNVFLASVAGVSQDASGPSLLLC